MTAGLVILAAVFFFATKNILEANDAGKNAERIYTKLVDVMTDDVNSTDPTAPSDEAKTTEHSDDRRLNCPAFIQGQDRPHLQSGSKGRRTEHQFTENILHDRTQTARSGFLLDRFSGDSAKSVVGESELDIVHFEKLLILFDDRIFRLGQDLNKCFFVKPFERGDNGNSSHKLGDQSELHKIMSNNVFHPVGLAEFLFTADGCFKAERR